MKQWITYLFRSIRRKHTAVWFAGTALVILGGVLLVRQNRLIKEQKRFQARREAMQTEMLSAIRNSSLIPLMSSLLETSMQEIALHPNRSLSKGTIARIAALNDQFAPFDYPYLAGDSVSQRSLSVERGQLLLALVNLGMDSSSLDHIKSQTSFAGADLKGADLRGMNLKGIDLRGANLEEAKLEKANMYGADLRKVNFWGANMQKSILDSADVRRSILSWAEMDSASLRKANLNGTTINNAKLRHADLTGSKMQFAVMSGSLFNSSNLSQVDLYATDLGRAQFSGANLSGANLTRAFLGEANMGGVQITRVTLGKDSWLTSLLEWQVVGAEAYQDRFRFVREPSLFYNFRLEEIVSNQ